MTYQRLPRSRRKSFERSQRFVSGALSCELLKMLAKRTSTWCSSRYDRFDASESCAAELVRVTL